MEIRHAGSKKAAGIPEQRNAQRRKKTDSLGLRSGDQAHFAFRYKATGTPRHQVRTRARKKKRHLVHKGNIQKFTEGAFRDWGYELAREEFRGQIVTERESWILDNLDKNPGLSIEQNGAMIEPGLEQATAAFVKSVCDEVKQTLDAIGATHGKGQWKKKLMINDRIADSVFQQVL